MYIQSRLIRQFSLASSNFERFLFHNFLYIANNLVEVYLNAHGTASTRCPSTCQHQSSKENGSTWHQLHATTPTALPQNNGHSHHLNNHHYLQESSHGATTTTIIGGSAKAQSPGLRRYSVIIFVVYKQNPIHKNEENFFFYFFCIHNFILLSLKPRAQRKRRGKFFWLKK